MEEAAGEENLSGFLPLFVAAQFVGIILVIFMTVWSIVYRGGFAWTSDIALQFNWHPFLMVLGMVYLQGSSILIYRGFRSSRKTSLKVAHAFIHAVALIFVLFASMAVFDNHNLATPPKPNLYTLHSWVGGLTSTLYLLQWVFSFMAFMYPGFSKRLRKVFLPYHVFFGHVVFAMGSAAAIAGLNEKAIFTLGKDYGQFVREGIIMNFIGLLIIVFAVLVVYLSTNPNYKRRPLPEDSILLNRAASD